jgi:hypothetical protein
MGMIFEIFLDFGTHRHYYVVDVGDTMQDKWQDEDEFNKFERDSVKASGHGFSRDMAF